MKVKVPFAVEGSLFNKWSKPDLAEKLNQILDPMKVTDPVNVPKEFINFCKKLGIELSSKESLKSAYDKLKVKEMSDFESYDPTADDEESLSSGDKWVVLAKAIYPIFDKLKDAKLSAATFTSLGIDSYFGYPKIITYVNNNRYFNMGKREYSYRERHSLTLSIVNDKFQVTLHQTRINGRKVDKTEKFLVKGVNHLANLLHKYLSGCWPDFSHKCVVLQREYEEKILPYLTSLPANLGTGSGYYIYASTSDEISECIAGPLSLEDVTSYKLVDKYLYAVALHQKSPIKLTPCSVNKINKIDLPISNLVRFNAKLKYSLSDLDRVISMGGRVSYYVAGPNFMRIAKTPTVDNKVTHVVFAESGNMYSSESRKLSLVKLIKLGKLTIVDSEGFIPKDASAIYFLTLKSDVLPESAKLTPKRNNYANLSSPNSISAIKKSYFGEIASDLDDDYVNRGGSLTDGATLEYSLYNHAVKCVYRYYNDGDNCWKPGDYMHSLFKDSKKAYRDLMEESGNSRADLDNSARSVGVMLATAVSMILDGWRTPNRKRSRY